VVGLAGAEHGSAASLHCRGMEAVAVLLSSGCLAGWPSSRVERGLSEACIKQ